MNARKITIPVSQLRNAVSDLIGYVEPLDGVHYLPVVAVLGGGAIDIIDGYHRIAGLIRGGAEAIDCVTCDDIDLLAAAASDSRSEQQAATSAIYAALR